MEESGETGASVSIQIVGRDERGSPSMAAEGMADSSSWIGLWDGDADGLWLGLMEGIAEGFDEGVIVGDIDGLTDGFSDSDIKLFGSMQ